MANISGLGNVPSAALGWFGLALFGLGILSVLILPWPWYGAALLPLTYSGAYLMMRAGVR